MARETEALPNDYLQRKAVKVQTVKLLIPVTGWNLVNTKS